jgi:hypothetical protein
VAPVNGVARDDRSRIKGAAVVETGIPGRQTPVCYQIRLAGHLDRRWASWFDGLAIRHAPDGTTMLTGPVADQAALYGLLDKARDLGLTLLAVARCEPRAVTPASAQDQ